MLDGTLLDQTRRDELRRQGAVTVAPLVGDSLRRAEKGLKAHASLRKASAGAHPAPAAEVAADDAGAVARDECRTDFAQACLAVGEALGHLQAGQPRHLLDALPHLFEGEATGAAALRRHWTGLGYAAADVDAYLAEATGCAKGLARIGRLIQDADDWRPAVRVFGAENPDPRHWGLGYSSTAEIHPTAQMFATVCRQVGITPSLFVVASIALLLHKMTEEMAAG